MSIGGGHSQRGIVDGRLGERGAAERILDCPSCAGGAMCPVEWSAEGPRWWRLLRRCGDCGAWCEALLSNQQAARLDCVLELQRDEIRRAADAIAVELMRAEAERFIA